MSPDDAALDRMATVESIIRSRRTSLLIDTARPVDDVIVQRLCSLVAWAPNHKRTWPWHLAVVSGNGRALLGAAFADDQADDGETDTARLDKTRRKYARATVCIVVGSTTDSSPERSGENRDAVAAGIQNLLLGATALGLSSFWSSPPSRRGRRTLDLCGFPSTAELVGVIYLGWPSGTAETPERPPLHTHIVR
jgi:nitroreductase